MTGYQMKIGIITVNKSANYGGVLQAYATTKFANKFGDAELIDYDNSHVKTNLRLIRFGCTFRDMFRMAKDLLRLLSKRKALKKFNAFFSEHLISSPTYSRQDLYAGAASHYDVYVSGSDQIWNPGCISHVGEIDPVYFLDFVPNGKKKISYASSLGSFLPDQAEAARMKKYLEGYSAISLREAGSASVISNIVGVKAKPVLDPCFLLTRQQWDELIKPEGLECRCVEYIAVYFLKVGEAEKRLVKELASRTGYEVWFLSLDIATGLKADKYIRTAGPVEFLSFIRNSKMVVTNSFHGTVFSLIYNIPFFVSSPPTGSNRIENILQLCEAENRLFTEFSSPIDIDDALLVNGVSDKGYLNLMAERDESIRFFTEAMQL